MVDLVVLNYNDALTTSKFLNQVIHYKIINYIIVVDNHSSDNSYGELHKFQSEKVHIICSKENGGYGSGNNLGILYAIEHFGSKKILLSNPDVMIDEQVIARLEAFLFEHTDYAVVAPFMCNTYGKKQLNSAFRIPGKISFVLAEEFCLARLLCPFRYRNLDEEKSDFKCVDGVSGSLFMFDTSYMLQFGMFDENIFLYGEEWVLAIKLKKAGLKVGLLLNDIFLHKHSVSISKTFKSAFKRKQLMVKSHLYILKTYYNENGFLYIAAWILTRISIIESCIIESIKQVKCKKKRNN